MRSAGDVQLNDLARAAKDRLCEADGPFYVLIIPYALMTAAVTVLLVKLAVSLAPALRPSATALVILLAIFFGWHGEAALKRLGGSGDQEDSNKS